MSFPYAFSRIAQAMRPSPIRELYPLIRQPGMISFAGGLPDPPIFPAAEFADCAGALRECGQEALQYGASEGYRPLVDFLRARLAPLLGRPVAPEQLVITAGSQQAMDMLARVLLDPGDVVVVEAPTYPGALHTFRNAGARFALVPCDAEGMQIERLPHLLECVERKTGRWPKLIYSIVNFGNPSGACLSEARRQELAAIARFFQVPVLEDDPYGELRWAGRSPPSLFSMLESGVLHAGSFSKILAPGCRVAWAVGDADVIRKMVVAKQGMDLCTSVVAQVLVAEYCRRGHLERHLPRIRAHYAAKAQAMAEALRAELPPGAARWTDPQGGFFFWLELPGRDSETLFHRAIAEGVAFLPGRAFFPARDETAGDWIDGRSFARLCFTFAQPDEIREGCRRLARALRPASAAG